MQSAEVADLWPTLELLMRQGKVRGFACGRAGSSGSATPGIDVLHGFPVLKGRTVRHATFEECTFADLRLHHTSFDDSRFTKCRFEDVRAWDTAFRGVTFERCHVGLSLGTLPAWRPNVLDGVTFDRCNLRSLGVGQAMFRGCTFRDCRFRAMPMEGAVFEDCKFIGKVEEAHFVRWPRKPLPGMPPNEMARCDFSQADLGCVRFEGMDLRDVAWPVRGHIPLRPLQPSLRRLRAAFGERTDLPARALMLSVEFLETTGGPGQQMAVLSESEIAKDGTPAFVDEVRAALREPEGSWTLLRA